MLALAEHTCAIKVLKGSDAKGRISRITHAMHVRTLVPSTVALLLTSITAAATVATSLLPAVAVLIVVVVATAAVVLFTEASLARLVVTTETSRHPVSAKSLFTAMATSSPIATLLSRRRLAPAVAGGFLTTIARAFLLAAVPTTVTGLFLLTVTRRLLLLAVAGAFLTSTIAALALLAISALLSVTTSVMRLTIAAGVAFRGWALALLAPVLLLA